MVQVIGHTNLLPDPQLRSTSALSVSNATRARVTTSRWVGTGAMRVTLTTATGYAFTPSTGAYSAAVNPAIWPGAVSLMVKLRANQSNRAFRVGIEFFSAAPASLSTVYSAYALVPNTGGFTTLFLHNAIIPATAATACIRIEPASVANQSGLGNAASAIGDTFDIGALDLMYQTEHDGLYVDGEQPGAIWNGTAHESTSWLADFEYEDFQAGAGGTMYVEPRLYRATLQNQRLDDITERVIVDGEITYTEGATVKTEMRVGLDDPDTIIEPYVDCLRPEVVVYDPEGRDGITTTYQLGLFVVPPMGKTQTSLDISAEVQAYDPTYLLSIRGPGETYTLAAGVNAIEKVRELVEAEGLRCEIPPSSKTLSKERWWKPGTKWLTIVNDLLESVGYYSLHSNRFGVARSFPYIDMREVEPVKRYTDATADGGWVLLPYRTEPTLTQLCNHVVVSKTVTEGTFIVAERENTNDATKTSINKIGRITKDVENSDIVDAAAAAALADRYLQEGSSVYMRSEMMTMLDPEREPYEVYELDLGKQTERGLPEGTGKFRCIGWRKPLSSVMLAMQHTLARTVEYGNAV